MTPRAPLDPRLLETLSAYLDGYLTHAEQNALHERLDQDENLRLQLEELRAVRESLRSLPPLRPPRALTLSPAQAVGKNSLAGRLSGFSSRGMAFGSALAALAFVVVASLDVFSSGSLMMATGAPMVAPQSLPSAQAMDKSRNEAVAEATPAAELAASPSSTAPALNDGCDDCPPADSGEEEFKLTTGYSTEPASRAFSPPDFQTAAPYLEGILAFSAVLLAGLAAIIRRRR